MPNSIVKAFKALADETRLDIVRRLLELGETSCAELSKEFPLAQSTLSHHFTTLENAEVLVMRKEGTAHYYRVNPAVSKITGINLNGLRRQICKVSSKSR